MFRRQRRCPLLVYLLLATQACAQIRIVAPDSLAKTYPETHGIVYGTTAVFGAPYNGKRVLGQLLHEPGKQGNHCSKDDYELKALAPSGDGTRHYTSSQELANVVLVRRGGCTFVTKVKIAQEKGAHAVIVVDKESSSLTSEDIQKIVMADDGYGDGVTIPSLLVSRFDGQKLIDATLGGLVMVELAWDIPRGEVVIADLWMSSGSQETSRFLEEFKDSAETLRYHLQFVPHYHIFSLPDVGAGDDPSYGNLCTTYSGRVRYCAPDPDGEGPITGAEVAEEDVRQLCIWNITVRSSSSLRAIGETQGATYSKAFWDYVTAFREDCLLSTGSNHFGEKCSYRIMSKLAGLPPGWLADEVRKCAFKFGEEMLALELRNAAWSAQALRINGWRYSGPLDPETVLKAICAGYSVKPKECDDLLSHYVVGASPWPIIWVLKFSTFVWLMITVVSLMFGLFLLYRRHTTKSVRIALREEVMLEVQTQMSDYISLQDSGTQPTSSRTLAF